MGTRVRNSLPLPPLILLRGFPAPAFIIAAVFFLPQTASESTDPIGSLIRELTYKPALYFQQKECLEVKATGYSNDESSINVPEWRDGLTSTLVRADRGTVAIDPSVIPYGSVLWIEDYGYGIALDTGSAIDGYEVDLFFPTKEEALEWGVRRVVACIIGHIDVRVVRERIKYAEVVR